MIVIESKHNCVFIFDPSTGISYILSKGQVGVTVNKLGADEDTLVFIGTDAVAFANQLWPMATNQSGERIILDWVKWAESVLGEGKDG